MKTFEIVCGDSKLTTLVQINGTTALAKDAKPVGHLIGIVKGIDDAYDKVTYYLCMETGEGFGIYATGVEREIEKIKPIFSETLEIECTEGTSRKTGKNFFKIVVTTL